MSRYNYQRRPTTEVKVGNVTIGGCNPIRLQSMTNTSTLDTEGSAQQAVRIAQAGGEIVRLTTQGSKEAANLADIKRRIKEMGMDIPLVADVHFNPKAAFVAAKICEKVRINPGNFVDAPRQFKHLEYTDEEYAAELRGIRDALVPFLDVCRANGTSIRLGVNHGSLSDRIMSHFGNTPEGMVESAMEFLRVCRDEDFHNVVISIKASNTVVMTQTVRLIAQSMENEGMHYPLHLGVTEAGDGEDGRIKSAVGIGTLLAEGYGDTIRVSLSEDPENEIPVAAMLRDYFDCRKNHPHIQEPDAVSTHSRAEAAPIPGMSVECEVGIADIDFEIRDTWHRVDASENPKKFDDLLPVILTSRHVNAPAEIMSYIDMAVECGCQNPFVVCLNYDTDSVDRLRIMAGADFGMLLLNGYCSAIKLTAPKIDPKIVSDTQLSLLQATRIRFSKPEYIACPGCGRTLFDLQSTLQEVKKATAHLKGLKIGVMGCIVNGPGEMADADYGYVGAGPGRVSLYKGKELKIKNIPTSEALPKLMELINEERKD
ncbi:MAG: (E)-4-hydroxy-3-methylbut-2-enyl-diphosphate synthase [Prevotella sp.]|nr:(E)-4-hydroxy-3-methylbut-2-enyl-diphosphate synthase [Bacteroides sp.]MCM1366664.1 (E)-4-hydroxy-3-methylbut-2-enyl-diphosphate synthase [Prevotella sp.]MCM1437331.1 (E)-4-hydroxy-3-methylbut-2-enyl-diphosphate synthase [Prevotella sp.]